MNLDPIEDNPKHPRCPFLPFPSQRVPFRRSNGFPSLFLLPFSYPRSFARQIIPRNSPRYRIPLRSRKWRVAANAESTLMLFSAQQFSPTMIETSNGEQVTNCPSLFRKYFTQLDEPLVMQSFITSFIILPVESLIKLFSSYDFIHAARRTFRTFRKRVENNVTRILIATNFISILPQLSSIFKRISVFPRKIILGF